ncbi:hypothetical protein BTA51_08080 [Hahella sp. CCB-MM4]|uniref:hypothetical protein n=1 Tax=Hahella sp. (strain CCB-MM4) TaxID=1926491 RepID=UPI000B9BA480|nr:hypothetical protein [Hahella sp. CCB-MM4]OZG73760.1 hypothetical protein BTA51_08080 [Hahella sp. CCB-MM4]
MTKGAMTLAEGSEEYKTDVNIVLNDRVSRKHVLRTTLNTFAVWKSKYGKESSPFQGRLKGTIKEAAFIDNEIWVFDIDGTRVSDIITAVSIAAQFYRVEPGYIMSNVYIKNLNVEGEHGMTRQDLVGANAALYSGVTRSLKQAAQHFGLRGSLDLFVLSNNANHKIPKDDLYRALKKGGASNVTSDNNVYRYTVGSNCGNERVRNLKEHLHKATIKL